MLTGGSSGGLVADPTSPCATVPAGTCSIRKWRMPYHASDGAPLMNPALVCECMPPAPF